jgi:hypothetical protein
MPPDTVSWVPHVSAPPPLFWAATPPACGHYARVTAGRLLPLDATLGPSLCRAMCHAMSDRTPPSPSIFLPLDRTPHHSFPLSCLTVAGWRWPPFRDGIEATTAAFPLPWWALFSSCPLPWFDGALPSLSLPCAAWHLRHRHRPPEPPRRRREPPRHHHPPQRRCHTAMVSLTDHQVAQQVRLPSVVLSPPGAPPWGHQRATAGRATAVAVVVVTTHRAGALGRLGHWAEPASCGLGPELDPLLFQCFPIFRILISDLKFFENCVNF